VQVALEEFEGTFNINRLYRHPTNAAGKGRHRPSKDKITQLAQVWKQRGWLTAPTDVTPTLSRLLDETGWKTEIGAV